MSQIAPKPRFTLAEYLALEPEGKVRHEYIDGELVAMTGMSRAHNTVVTNLTIHIGSHCRGTPCRVAAHDMKVVIAAVSRGYYPDLMVSCSDPADEPDRYTETRPRLIAEVLSPATASFDRYDKRLDYQRLDSLQDYLLIDQDQPEITVYHRSGEAWTETVYGADDTIMLASIDLRLPVALIYEGL